MQPGDENDRVDAGGQADTGRVGAEFDCDPVVVPMDGAHQDEKRGHGNNHDVGTVRELREQHDDQDEGGEDRADAVDEPGPVQATAPAAGAGGMQLGASSAAPFPIG